LRGRVCSILFTHDPVSGGIVGSFQKLPTDLVSVEAEIEREGDAVLLNLIHPRRKVVGVSRSPITDH